MDSRLVVLVARPTPTGIDERSLTALADAVAARVEAPVRIAHLDQADPSVHAVLDDAARIGPAAVLLVPMAVPADAYLHNWIGRAVANWRETRPGHCLDVRIADDLTATPGLADAVAALAAGPGVEVTASPAAFRSPSWSVLPTHDRHLFACRGPRCTAYGAGRTHRALSAAARGTTTLVTPVGCLGPCNLGPLVVEHPGGTWHESVDAERAARIVDDRVAVLRECAPGQG